MNEQRVHKTSFQIDSAFLERKVDIDCFWPFTEEHELAVDLLLINDGQNMEELGFNEMINGLISNNEITPLLCVGIYAGDRMMEYGTAGIPDYQGRGDKAGSYSSFILKELIPFIKETYRIKAFDQKSIAGFSLGGLSALDIVWNHSQEFTIAGVFSGSLWWRTKSLDDGYNEDTDRIMHARIRNTPYRPGLKFFLQTGTLDETMDRNNNGIIDSIDDTLGLIDELAGKGYDVAKDIHYVELQEGRHDMATWARAMPLFLRWAWGK